mgnify:FL=1
MSRPKKQLLDLLREQEGRLPEASPSMKDAVSRARPMGSVKSFALPRWAIQGVAASAILLLMWWLVGLWSGADKPTPLPNLEISVEAASASAVQEAQKEYGVRVITYASTMKGRAYDVALELKAQGVPELNLLQIQAHFVIFAGRASRAADLESFLAEVKQMTIASAPNQYPFATAIIEAWPTLK